MGLLNEFVLTEENVLLVRSLARCVWYQYNIGIDIQDLIQAGCEGLIEASRDYNPASEASFQTYARIRIYGSILDEVRSYAPRGLGVRRIAQGMRLIRKATERIEVREQRPATTKDLTRAVKNYHTLVRECASVASSTLTEDIVDPCNPEESVHFLRETQRLESALESLGPREMAAVQLYYFDGLNLKAAGKRLNGISEARVSQILKQVRGKMRKMLEV